MTTANRYRPPAANKPSGRRSSILFLICASVLLGLVLDDTGSWPVPIARRTAVIPMAMALVLSYVRSDTWRQIAKLKAAKTPLILSAAAATVSTVTSENIGWSLTLYAAGIGMAAMAIAAINCIRTDKDLKMLVVVVTSAAFVVCLRGIYEYFVTRDEVVSGMYSANTLGGFILIILPLAIVHSLQAKKSLGRIWFGAVAAAAVICLFFTFSRGAIAGMILQGIVLTVLTGKKRLLAIAIPVIAAVIFIQSDYRNLVTTVWDREYNTNVDRMKLWQAGLAMIAERPVFGFGAGTFRDVYPRYLEGQPGDQSPAPCNIYLHIAATTGLSGLFAAFWLIIVFLRHLTVWRSSPLIGEYKQAVATAVLAAAAGLLFQGMFDY